MQSSSHPTRSGVLIVLLSAAFASRRTLKLIDLEDEPDFRASLALPGQTIFRIRFTPDGKSLAAAVGPSSGNGKQMLVLWETSKLTETATLAVNSGTVSGRHSTSRPTGRHCSRLAIPRGRVTFGAASPIFQSTGTLRAYKGAARRSLAFSPDGRRLVTVGASQDQAGEVKIWNLNRDFALRRHPAPDRAQPRGLPRSDGGCDPGSRLR